MPLRQFHKPNELSHIGIVSLPNPGVCNLARQVGPLAAVQTGVHSRSVGDLEACTIVAFLKTAGGGSSIRRCNEDMAVAVTEVGVNGIEDQISDFSSLTRTCSRRTGAALERGEMFVTGRLSTPLYSACRIARVATSFSRSVAFDWRDSTADLDPEKCPSFLNKSTNSMMPSIPAAIATPHWAQATYLVPLPRPSAIRAQTELAVTPALTLKACTPTTFPLFPLTAAISLPFVSHCSFWTNSEDAAEIAGTARQVLARRRRSGTDFILFVDGLKMFLRKICLREQLGVL